MSEDDQKNSHHMFPEPKVSRGPNIFTIVEDKEK